MGRSALSLNAAGKPVRPFARAIPRTGLGPCGGVVVVNTATGDTFCVAKGARCVREITEKQRKFCPVAEQVRRTAEW